MELVQFLAIFLGQVLIAAVVLTLAAGLVLLLVLKAIASIRKARQALRTMPKFNWDSI
jgi:hypothetical protein